MQSVIGIDISKKKMNYCVVTDAGEILEEGNIENNLTGFGKLLPLMLVKYTTVIFEATGVYSRRFQYFLDQNQISYIRMNPLLAKKEMDSLRVTKNDVIDAKRLAELQLRKKYQPVESEEKVYTELRHQHRFYQDITTDGAKAKSRLHKSLQDTFSEIEHLFIGTNEMLYRVVEKFPHAKLVTEKTEQEIIEELLPLYSGSLSRAQTVAKRLKELAKKTAVSVPLDSKLTEQTIYWAKTVQYFNELKKQTIDSMFVTARGIEEVEILESIPGIGRTHAIGLIAELGDIRRFSTPQKLNAFIGIDLRFNDSGQIKSSGYITKRGNSVARKIMYTIVVNVIASSGKGESNALSDWYRRRAQNVSGSKKKIIIGLMDRLLRVIHHLVLHNEKFSNE